MSFIKIKLLSPLSSFLKIDQLLDSLYQAGQLAILEDYLNVIGEIDNKPPSRMMYMKAMGVT